MRRFIPWLLWLATATPAAAYELKLTSDGHPVRWVEGTVRYAVDVRGARDLPLPAAVDAVDRAFAAWRDAPGVAIGFVNDGVREGLALGFDEGEGAVNENAVLWSRDQWGYGEEALAVTVTLYKRSSGQLIDADIYINEAHYGWGVGREAETDLQNALTHEVGHFIGLAHSDVPEATMYASSPPGEIEKRTLHADDLDGASFLYPGADRVASPQRPIDTAAFRDDQVAPPAADPEEEVPQAFSNPVNCAVARPGAPTAPPPAATVAWAIGLLALARARRARREAAR